jgi:hypothetical protein
MGNQSAKKTSKRIRTKRSAVAILKQVDRTANRIAYTEKHGHAQSRGYGGDLVDNSLLEPDPGRKLYSFEDEYKTYRRTRGRRGLAPNPNKRPDENHHIALFKRSASYCGKFPIGQLMEKPIRKGK